MEDIVIKIQNLSKEYMLGNIGRDTLNAELQSWWAKIRGKEDPNSRIDEKKYEKNERFLALDHINIEIRRGEALGVIGSNGAGKSTLLKILSRVTAPTEGDIWIKGRVSSMLEVGTGFHGELTGRENIYVNGAILGMSKDEVDSKIDDIIEFSECAQFIDTPVKRYSSGMYVKLAFAVAAHLDAEIMIMDEVLAVGDMKFQKKCLGKMRDAASEEGKTVLYVSHNMNTIRQLCDRCIVLDKGRIVFEGETEDAIAVYMDREKGDLITTYDLGNTERPSIEHGRDLIVTKFEFLGKEKAIFGSDEKMKFSIEWESKKDLKNIQLYFAVDYIDSVCAGMSQSQVIGDAKKDTVQSCILEFDISNLVEGMYYFYIDVFSMNEFGTHFSYDHPMKKIYFEVVNTELGKSINWIRRAWGSVRLNEMKVLERNL